MQSVRMAAQRSASFSIKKKTFSKLRAELPAESTLHPVKYVFEEKRATNIIWQGSSETIFQAQSSHFLGFWL